MQIGAIILALAILFLLAGLLCLIINLLRREDRELPAYWFVIFAIGIVLALIGMFLST